MADAIAAALDRWGWSAARRGVLAGDASARTYLRLHRPGGRRAVLMCAPPAETAAFDAFRAVAGHLRRWGYSAPMIIAADRAAGLMLLEDLGDGGLARLAATPGLAAPLYTAAVDMLADLADLPPPPGLPRLDADAMGAMIDPVFRHYAPAIPASAARATQTRLAELVAVHAGGPATFALRDCHAENLIWLPRRAGRRRLGLLDFQDAVMAPAGYDLVSFLDDARRDVPRRLADDLLARFAARRGLAPGTMAARAAILSLQRNLRILGIFARLAGVEGRRSYLRFVPRARAHVDRALAHPACAALRAPLAGLPAGAAG